ncbi:MAG TPA: STAS domain-containing protein [Actinophytocola sp.]|uniref:STAS domain-containing protein n=1 Tax=Actinophytocola sp. TaxID=1872138 RepID=UPI002DDD6A9D|nr:STAS domain-containing protein [Actinophytocola sp.]HEV2780715.1 STAS domain-containing protein [Actinophytocola sp.]
MNDPVRQTAEPEERMQVEVEQAAPDVAVLRLTGDLDLLTAGVLHGRLWPHLERPNSTVVLDFAQVGFLGSAGLSELVAANDTATKNGVRLVLVASSRTVLRPLEITGLRSLFQVFDSVEAALRQV